VSAQGHVVVGDRMYCGCGGVGMVTEVAEAAPGLLLATCWIEHRPSCPGVAQPDRAFVMSTAALDIDLPGIEPPGRRQRRGSREEGTRP
jgi:hypothetical protein